MAISKAMPADSVNVRTGGDEFCSVLIGCHENDMQEIIDRIEKDLEKYNNMSELPYKVGCSCGYYSMKASEADSIEQIAAFADEEMYKVKTRKKAMRKMS